MPTIAGTSELKGFQRYVGVDHFRVRARLAFVEKLIFVFPDFSLLAAFRAGRFDGRILGAIDAAVEISESPGLRV